MDWHKNTLLRTSPLKNEATLLSQVAMGNDKAFAKLFHHYRTRIYSYAFHLFENSGLADELVQDVFLKVWLNRGKLPQLTRFESWLFIIARNQVFDTLKLMAKEATARKQLVRVIPATQNPVENQLIAKENELRLHHALDRLSPQQKLVFTLSRQQGMNHEEIASRLNISRNTVKTHLVHALKTLRGVMYLNSDHIMLIWLFCYYFTT
ncbi:MAG TPA: RNA polymerase sigma-70 factor [Puia sp.]|nr:RNA polymerase sigma-70 factor [Puia sp.]